MCACIYMVCYELYACMHVRICMHSLHCTVTVVNFYYTNCVDLIEVLQRTKTSTSTDDASSNSSQDLLDDALEGMINPMESSGVDQLLARVLSSTGIVNKTISPPSANRFMPPPATIEEIPGMCV